MPQVATLMSTSQARRAVVALLAVLCLLGALLIADSSLAIYYHA
jgi:hypothetical protein